MTLKWDEVIFMFTLENLSKIEINYSANTRHFLCQILSSTNAVLENSLKFGPSFWSKYKNCITTPFLWDFMRPKMCASIFLVKRPRSTFFNAYTIYMYLAWYVSD